ncbi:MAG: phosphatase PAP2 family protein [Candidatus Tantalella remota]|nr:phosphatase PAP2 family protein [Candidatus Tantalella remota]
MIVFAGALAFFAGKRYLKVTALIFLSSFTVARYSYKTVKFFIQRPRPFQALEDVRLVLGSHGGYSFPSGHATTSFCLATVIVMRYPKLRYPMFVAASLVAISRPYVGVHYPSDILVGSLLGIFIGYFVTKTATKYLEQPV